MRLGILAVGHKLPDWVEVCRQRAEAEARERASRGL